MTQGPDLRLPCVACGDDGPPVVFLHGFLGEGQDFADVAEALLPRRCLLLDLPGHGAAARWPGPWTDEALLDAVAASIPPGSVLVGYSMGGRVALRLALSGRVELSGLLVESGHPGLRSSEERAHRERDDEERARRLRTDAPGFLEAWLAQPLFASLRHHAAGRDVLEQRRARLRLEGAEGWARALTAWSLGRQPDLWPLLSRCPCPATFVAGALDERYAGIAAEVEAAAPAWSVEVVTAAGHNVHLERPAAFLASLDAVLARVDRSPGPAARLLPLPPLASAPARSALEVER